MKVKKLHIYYINKRTKEREKVTLIPESQIPVVMKNQLARELEKRRKRILYYYVVVEVQKSDKSSGFRTIVPKTLVA